MYIAFGSSAYDNNDYGLPPIRLENMFTQMAPERVDRQSRLVPTPGLVEFVTGFTGTAGAIFYSEGVLSGKIITATGTEISSVTSGGTRATVGSIASGTLSPQFAATQAPDLVVVAGGNTYTVTGTVNSFTWSGPTGDIESVDVIAQRHLFTEAGSGRLWISDTADPTTVTEFITAEYDPDGLKAVAVVSGDIYLMGSTVTEVAYATGDTSVPIAFRPNFIIPYGLKGSRAYTKGSGDLFFVASDSQVYAMGGGRPTAIGTQPIVDRISALSTANLNSLSMRYYEQRGHKFVVLTIPGYGDMFFDITTGQWHRRRRLLTTESGLGPVVEAFDKVYALDNKASGNATLLQVDPATFTNDTDYIRRVATSLIPNEDSDVVVNAVRIEGQTGVALDGAGQGSDPQLLLRVALDGRSFGNEISRSMGKVGEFRKSIVYGPLGISRPGVVALEVAYSDPVDFSITGAIANPNERR